jgi:type IV secretory pathway VirB10-like protein
MLLAAIAIAAALTGPAPEASPSSHDEVTRRAKQLWAEGDDAALLELFEAAYAKDPRPEYLFGQGRAAVALGRCALAVEVLTTFIDLQPPGEQVAAAQAEIDRCEPAPPQEPEPDPPAIDPQPPPPARVDAPPPERSPIDRAPDRRPRERDDVALGLGITGAALVVGGSVALGVGIHRTRSPDGTQTDDVYATNVRTGRATAIAGATMLSVGSALAIAAIVEYVVRRRAGVRRTARESASRRASGPSPRDRAAAHPGLGAPDTPRSSRE